MKDSLTDHVANILGKEPDEEEVKPKKRRIRRKKKKEIENGL